MRSTSCRPSTSASASSCPKPSTVTCSTRSRARASSPASPTRTLRARARSSIPCSGPARSGTTVGKPRPSRRRRPMPGGSFGTQRWELFNADADPSECHDLADTKPEMLEELIALWWAEAGKYNALPLESRDALAILLEERPQLSKPRDRYVYYPDCAEIPESVAPNIRNRSYAVAVEVKIDSPQANGVLFAQG